MKSFNSHSIFLALLILLLSPLTGAHASPAPADSVYFCVLPFDYQQGQRDHIRPAAKRLSDCAFCDFFGGFTNSEEEEEDEATEDDDGSGEEESESSEDVTEDFLISEPSLPPLTIRENFELTSFYQQWIDVEGYPVVASENVNPYAVKEAAWLIRQLMSHRPDVLQAMVQNKARFSVIAYNETLTQIPEYSYLRPGFFWDGRARGLGAKEGWARKNLRFHGSKVIARFGGERAEEKTGRAYIGPVRATLVAIAQNRLGLPDVPQLQQNV